MSRREQIKMSDAEVAAFLAEERILTCATLGPRGWPHLMPLWYIVRGAAADPVRPIADRSVDGGTPARLWAWTYAASQKVRNLERDRRATVLIETGESYEQLRGIALECDVVMHRDHATVAALGQEIFRRYASPRGAPPLQRLDDEVAAMVDRQAAKRVGLEFRERHRATWDHRKLGGVY